MTSTHQPVAAPPLRVDEAALSRSIERMLRRVEPRLPRIVAVRREPSAFASLRPAEVLTLSLADGSKRSLFVKYLGDEHADHPEKQCRDREVRIYEELLTDETLPVVRYYGSKWEARTQRRAVILEYLADWDLRYQSLDHWYTAARRLAELHAHFASRADALRDCGFLLPLDADFLRSWAVRALRVVRDLDARLASALAGVVRGYDRPVALIARQPRTLVHNDLAPKNVLSDRSRTPARIAFVDWEVAGVGCGLLDFVDLKYGLHPQEDATMRRAYIETLAGTGLLPDGDELQSLFDACELHKVMHRLAHSASWALSITTVQRWVSDAIELMARR